MKCTSYKRTVFALPFNVQQVYSWVSSTSMSVVLVVLGMNVRRTHTKFVYNQNLRLSFLCAKKGMSMVSVEKLFFFDNLRSLNAYEWCFEPEQDL